MAGSMDSEDVQYFKKDGKAEYHEDVRKFDSGVDQAPKKTF